MSRLGHRSGDMYAFHKVFDGFGEVCAVHAKRFGDWQIITRRSRPAAIKRLRMVSMRKRGERKSAEVAGKALVERVGVRRGWKHIHAFNDLLLKQQQQRAVLWTVMNGSGAREKQAADDGAPDLQRHADPHRGLLAARPGGPPGSLLLGREQPVNVFAQLQLRRSMSTNNRAIRSFLLLTIALGFQHSVSGLAVAADVESTAKHMPFDQCLTLIRQIGSKLGVAPINIVETNDVRITRFCASDGSVLLSCSRPDEKMVATRSPHRSGCQ